MLLSRWSPKPPQGQAGRRAGSQPVPLFPMAPRGCSSLLWTLQTLAVLTGVARVVVAAAGTDCSSFNDDVEGPYWCVVVVDCCAPAPAAAARRCCRRRGWRVGWSSSPCARHLVYSKLAPFHLSCCCCRLADYCVSAWSFALAFPHPFSCLGRRSPRVQLVQLRKAACIVCQPCSASP